MTPVAGRRSLTVRAVAFGLVALGATLAGADLVADRLTRAGAAFLASLDAGQRESGRFPFASEERFDLRLVPFFLDGIRASDLDERQWRKLRAMLGATLGPEGLAKVETIMSLEREVARLERESWVRWPLHFFRDPRRYFVALFGTPRDGEPWGFRFDGHHVSVNATVVPGAVPSATPLFLGSQPRQVPADWDRAGLRALAAEEDRARALYVSLPPPLRESATIPFRAGRELFLGAGREVELEGPPRGLARGDMPPRLQAKLDALLEVYLGNLAPEIAAAERAGIEAAGRDRIHFAWAGSEAVGEPAYYRLQGPTFLVEYDDTLDGADHVHTIWRDRDGDFGEDLLARHYALAHAR